MALDHVGVDVATILAGAGVLGLAIGFGAQTLVKDCLSGFFLIFEGILAQGDVVELDEGVVGAVEVIGLRVSQIRAYSGQLWYVPNGEITRVGNWNRGWARAIATVSVAYEQDIAGGLKVMQAVGEQWAAENPDIVLEAPEAHGALSLNDSGISVRLVIKIDNSKGDLWRAQRELLKAIKAGFDESDIEIPFPRIVLYRPDAETEHAEKEREVGPGLRSTAGAELEQR